MSLLLNKAGEVQFNRAFMFLENLTDLNLIDCNEDDLKTVCRCVKISNLVGLTGEEMRALALWCNS